VIPVAALGLLQEIDQRVGKGAAPFQHGNEGQADRGGDGQGLVERQPRAGGRVDHGEHVVIDLLQAQPVALDAGAHDLPLDRDRPAERLERRLDRIPLGDLPEGVIRRLLVTVVAAAGVKLAVPGIDDEAAARAIELERDAVGPACERGEEGVLVVLLHPQLVGFGDRPAEGAGVAGDERGDRRLILLDAQGRGEIGADRQAGRLGKQPERQGQALAELLAEPHGAELEPAQVGLERRLPQELVPRLLGEQTVDLEVDARVALAELTLLRHALPAEHADRLDGVGSRDGADVFHGLEGGEFSHGGGECGRGGAAMTSGVSIPMFISWQAAGLRPMASRRAAAAGQDRRRDRRRADRPRAPRAKTSHPTRPA
jgi:hypothetical protein